MNTILVLNKPSGMTSFDAVRKCRRMLDEKKAGHSGTLDPNARGVMLIFLGKYTKLIPFCVKDHKHYEAEFSLGEKTDTGDIWGHAIENKTPISHSQEELDHASAALTGTIQQVPPMYSAVRKDGKKLYEYARQGIEVERKARIETVNSLFVRQIGDNLFSMDATVSSGTYIRTLIEDYAALINELGTMTSLLREGIESIHIEDACSFEDIQNGNGMIDPSRVISPEWKMLETDDEDGVRNGRHIRIDTDEPKVILTKNGILLAAYERMENGYYQCVRGLC
jgi:tRNA pseudouridine55 synthase